MPGDWQYVVLTLAFSALPRRCSSPKAEKVYLDEAVALLPCLGCVPSTYRLECNVAF